MKKPKVLIIDIECKPILAHVWRIFDENIGINQIKTDKSILSWAAKWKGEKEIFYEDLRGRKDIDNDKPILKNLRDLLDEAEIIIGHNVARFDLKNIRTRCLKHGMRRFNDHTICDTLTIAKRHYSFTSNKLDFIADFLGLGGKRKSKKFQGFDLWRECMEGNLAAWKEMEEYNKHDVILTEQVYDRLSIYGKTYNHLIYLEAEDPLICECGSDKLHSNGLRGNRQGVYRRLRCLDCGRNYRQKQNQVPTSQRKRFIIKE